MLSEKADGKMHKYRLNQRWKMSELKICPFCGGKARMSKNYDGDMVQWDFVKCDSCGARSRGKWVSHSSNACPIYYEEVRQEWNTRTKDTRIKELEQQLAQYECEHEKGLTDYCEPCGRINSN